MSEPNQVIRTNRQVIENKLLARLSEPGTVAALFSKQDLEDLLFILLSAETNIAIGAGRAKRLADLKQGFEQLLKEAFP